MEAAKRKTFWLSLLALACVFSTPIFASSVDVLQGKTRAELSAETGQNGIERSPFYPGKHIENYDVGWGTASDSPVAPIRGAGLADDAVELAAQRRLVEMTGNTPYAHYLGKHSPLVSDQALIARATTGLDPWEGIVKTYQKGKKAGQPILYDSTRFNNYQDMLESIEKAQRALGARFPNGGIPANGATVTMDMLRDVGLGYGKNWNLVPPIFLTRLADFGV
jgi:hypothetical protein